MNNTIKIFAAGLLLASAASCNLDLTPKGSISYNPGQQIITNKSDLEGFEANILSSMRSLEYGVYDIADEVMMDGFNATIDFGNNYGSIHRADDTFTSGDYDSEDNWLGPYSAIKNFNIFIEGAQSVPDGLQEQAAVVRGEAYFGRAFAYLHLARHFGKAYSASAATDPCVPLVTVYEQTARPERASVADIYGQIKKDLDSAAVLLAGVSGAARAHKPTIDAVNALYARYYIDIKDYQNAAKSAMAVINTDKYALSSTAAEMEAEWINDKGKEPIIQYYASTTEGSGGHSACTGMSKTDEVGLYYRPYFLPTKTLVESYDEGDLRLAQWFDGENYPCFHVSSYYNLDTKNEFKVFVKYFGNPDIYTGNPNSAQAIKPLLISEMYLIAAEAYLAAGDAASAKTQLNVLQEKRGASLTNATSEAVKKEWFRETVGEGLRMSCLKRWGEGFNGREPQDGVKSNGVNMSGDSYELKVFAADDFHFQWPVPKYEMQTNLNLVQNPGYTAE